MEGLFDPTCQQSVLTGQPASSCVNHQCMNDPSKVKHWTSLPESEKKEVLGERVSSCLAGTGIPLSFKTDDELRVPYLQKLDLLIREQKYPPDSSLKQMMESEIPCEDLISKARSLQAK